jgi:hypothetical protein
MRTLPLLALQGSGQFENGRCRAPRCASKQNKAESTSGTASIHLNFIDRIDIGTKKQSLIKEDTKEIEVPPGVEKTFEFTSGEINFKKVKDWRAKETTESGAKLQGWVIMIRKVTSNGVIAVKSSMSGLEKFVTSPNELESLKTGGK